jgi:hypothetical protein
LAETISFSIRIQRLQYNENSIDVATRWQSSFQYMECKGLFMPDDNC